MTRNLKKTICGAVAMLGALTLGAAPATTPDAASELMVRRADLMIQARELDDDLGRSWFDSSCTSPEIEKLRTQLRVLEAELVKTREALKAKVLELPANREKQAKADAAKAEINALTEKINVYLKQNGMPGNLKGARKQPPAAPQK